MKESIRREGKVSVSDAVTESIFFPKGVMLRDVCPDTCRALSEHLRASGDVDLAAQMKRVVVPVQGFAGTPEDFSFMAWPVPRLTKEERYNMELQEWREINILVGDADFRICTDDFGQINWFYIKNSLEIYSSLRAALLERHKRP